MTTGDEDRSFDSSDDVAAGMTLAGELVMAYGRGDEREVRHLLATANDLHMRYAAGTLLSVVHDAFSLAAGDDDEGGRERMRAIGAVLPDYIAANTAAAVVRDAMNELEMP